MLIFYCNVYIFLQRKSLKFLKVIMNKITCYNEVVEHTPPAILLSLKKKKWVVRLKLRISILYHNLEKNL